MKNYLFGFYLFVASTNLFAQDFVASSPLTVASGYGNYHPQMEVLGDGQLGIIWTNSVTNNLYFSKRTAPEIFSAPMQLNPVGTEVQDYNWSGPDLSIWGDHVYVVYHDLGFEDGHIYLVKSDDNGVTFGDTTRVDFLTDAYAQFPDVAVYNDTVFVVFMEHGLVTMNPQMVLARSTDGGQTFEPQVDVSGWVGLEVCDCCQPEIIVDAQRVIVYYRENDANTRDIKAAISYDRGATFTQYIEPDNHNWTIAACPSTGPDARFLENGNPVSIYRTTVSSAPKIYVNEYDLVNDNTVNEVAITMDGVVPSGINYPQISVDGSLIGIVWEGLGSSTDVFFNGSNTGVANLLPSNAINVTNMGGSQSKPDIVALNSSFHIVYSELTGAEVKYVSVQATSSITDDAKQIFSFYPNPTTENLTLDLADSGIETGKISVTDLSGRVVFEFDFSDPLVIIPAIELTQGMYQVRVVGNDQILEFRFIKS
ncbi:MAG: T9SS type A sorting domain-containing protein [Crocinitomicaceae bacterium]|nr:T9SS type A sorting domain-containing protein [Crocinitomicaceae bacterium]